MSDYAVGDKVTLNDEGLKVVPGASSRGEYGTLLGTLTIDEVCPSPTNEDPEGQTLFFKEIQYIVGSYGVDPVID